MYKIKPSLIEDYRIVRDEVFEKDPLELISRIKGEGVATYKMSIGTLIHAYLEKEQTELETQEGLITLSVNEQVQLQDIKSIMGTWISEVRFTYNLTPDILVSGVIDKILGVLGGEVKTGARFYGVDFYDNSLQWKLYCEALGLKMFTYYHILISGTNERTFKLSEMTFYPYKGMKDQVISECYSFINWCKLNNLEKYITV